MHLSKAFLTMLHTYPITNGSSLLAVVVCVIGNIINVYAEEGLFRGLFCKIGIQYYSQKTANIIQALLFGIWHITNVINPLLDGSMNITMAAFMGIGYILLSRQHKKEKKCLCQEQDHISNQQITLFLKIPNNSNEV